MKGNESLRHDLVAAVGALDADNKEWPRFHAQRLNDPRVKSRYREFVKTFIEKTGIGAKT